MSIARYGINSQGVFVSMTVGGYVSYQDYEKPAAENAGLKESRKNLAEFIHEELDADYPLNMSIETPATDAFLAEVRSQGVEMFAAYCGEENSVFVEAKAYYRSLPDAAYEFAAQLRKGVQS